MTDPLDLDAIEARANRTDPLTVGGQYVVPSEVRALVAELRTARAERAQAINRSIRFGARIEAALVICDRLESLRPMTEHDHRLHGVSQQFRRALSGATEPAGPS